MNTMNQVENQLELFHLPVSETAIECFKLDFAGEPETDKISTKDKRRYYMHRVLKNRYSIDPDKMTIELPCNSFYDIPVGDRYYINQLLKLGYNLQINLL